MSKSNPDDDVVVVDYDQHWPKAYQEEAERISLVLDHTFTEIHHIGSTSVPGLSAKPTIDILVVVLHFAPVEEYIRRLEPLGYQHVSHKDDAIRLFFCKGTAHAYHLHIVERGSWEHRRHLLFRDYLRAHPETAQVYGELKQELADRFATDRPSYTKNKTTFVKAVTAIAAEEWTKS